MSGSKNNNSKTTTLASIRSNQAAVDCGEYIEGAQRTKLIAEGAASGFGEGAVGGAVVGGIAGLAAGPGEPFIAGVSALGAGAMSATYAGRNVADQINDHNMGVNVCKSDSADAAKWAQMPNDIKEIETSPKNDKIVTNFVKMTGP